MENQILGNKGENLACKYLEEKGYKILIRNFRCKCGEIDIIAQDKDEIVFVEVKTRTNLNYGLPSEAVDKKKKIHILRVSKYFIYIKKLEKKKIRFDVIEVYKNRKFYINHIKNVDIF